MTEEYLIENIPEYKEFLETHPTEWIDQFIRERLMPTGEAVVGNDMIWIANRIGKRLKEKYFEWIKESYPHHSINKDDYDVALQWESIPAYYDAFGKFHEPAMRGWIFKIKILPRDKNKSL